MNEKHLQTVAMEELWKSQSDGYIPALLEIYNPDIKWTDESLGQDPCYLRVISDTNAVVYKGKRYLPCKFEYTPPEENGKKIGNASLTISSIDQRVPMILRSIDLQCEITINAYFSKVGSVVKFYPIDSLKAMGPTASYNKSTATFNLVFKDVSQLQIPTEEATSDKLPSVNEND